MINEVNGYYKNNDYDAFKTRVGSYSRGAVLLNSTTPDSFTKSNNSSVLDKIKNPDNGADDGKISTIQKLKSVAKGLVSPVTSMFSSPKNFLIGSAMIAGGALLIAATGGAAAPLLIAVGVGTGAVQAGKGVYKASTAKTDEEAKQAWESIGAGTSAIALSVTGAKASLKSAGLADEASNLNALQATAKCITKSPEALVNSGKMVFNGEAATNIATSFGNIKGKFSKRPVEDVAPEVSQTAEQPRTSTVDSERVVNEQQTRTTSSQTSQNVNETNEPVVNQRTTRTETVQDVENIGTIESSRKVQLQAEVESIRKGEKGVVRSLKSLTEDDVMKVIESQLNAITPGEISSVLKSFPAEDRALAAVLLKRMTQFGNMDSVDALNTIINKKYGPSLYDGGRQPSIATNMRYLDTKNALKLTPDFSGSYGTCILDEMTLERLETDPAFLNKVKNNNNVDLVYPEGWTNGINPFNQNQAIQPKVLEVLETVKKIQAENPDVNMQDAVSEAINKPIMDRLKKLGLDKRTDVIQNTKHSSSSVPTAESIAENLKPSGMTKSQLVNALNQLPEQYRPYYLELLARDTNVFSPRALTEKLVDMHSRIVASNGGSSEGIYYFIPNTNKSYGMITMQYKIANNIPTSNIFSDIMSVPKGAKKIVILDDVAGSGDSLKNKFNDLSAHLPKNSSKTPDIIIAPVLTTERAANLIKPLSNNSYKPLYIAGEQAHTFKNSAYYQSLSHNQQQAFIKTMGSLGYDSNGLDVAFPYMSPDNNNAFFSTVVAKFFTLNGAGVKNEGFYKHPITRDYVSIKDNGVT